MYKKDLIIKKTFTLATQSHQKSKFNTAEKLYGKILKINPNHFGSIFYLGVLLLETNSLIRAKQLFQKAIEINPNYAPAYNNLGIVLYSLKETKQAISFYQKAIKIHPAYSDAHNNLGMVLQQLGKYRESQIEYYEAIKNNSNNLSAHHNLGIVYQKLRKHQDSIKSFERALEINSKHADTHYKLGAVFTELGEFGKAVDSYKTAVKHEPENLVYLYSLNELKNETLNDNLRNKIQKVLNNEKTSNINSAYGNFLLSKYELKNKKYKKEIEYLKKGHRKYFESKNNEFTTQVKYWLQEVIKIKELKEYGEIPKNKEWKNDKINPIFIIGIPRSGSTLIEQVITSGKEQIQAGEETEILNYFIKDNIKNKKSISLDIENLRKRIIEKYKEKGLLTDKSKYTFTDKSLDNFYYINIIKNIFPSAKIINCKRNPLSCIMSILKNNLTGLSWAHKIDDIFAYINNYHEINKQFNNSQTNYIYEIEYEKFVNNPLVESKKLMKFCNLEWSKSCLNFFKKKDLISQTASNIQIRKEIYKDSINKYDHYKEFISKHGKEYTWFI